VIFPQDDEIIILQASLFGSDDMEPIIVSTTWMEPLSIVIETGEAKNLVVPM